MHMTRDQHLEAAGGDGDLLPGKPASPRSVSTLALRILRRRVELGLTQASVAAGAGCSKSYLCMLESGERDGQVRAELLTKLEAVLELPKGELVRLQEWGRTPESVKREVERLRAAADGEGAGVLEAMRSKRLDDLYKSGALRKLVTRIDPTLESSAADDAVMRLSTRADVRAPARGAAASANTGELQHLGARARVMPLEVPIINAVAAGYPREFTDLGFPARVADEHVRVADVSDADAFAARVVGDSMEPEYREGDVVVFSPSRPARSGCDCFARLERDAESTFKRVYFLDRDSEPVEIGANGELSEKVEWIRLVALNAKYAERRVHREEVAGLYPAVSVTRSIT
jgi:transcriptional regulator with XRE-family HTH domain